MSAVNRFSFAEVKAPAVGLWPGILVAAGITPEVLNGPHHSCSGRGGGKRIGGDGFRLLEHVFGWSAGESLRFVADYLGLAGREVTQADRNAWRRREVLKALAHEIEVLRLAVADALNGRDLSAADRDREQLAVSHVRDGLKMLYGD